MDSFKERRTYSYFDPFIHYSFSENQYLAFIHFIEHKISYYSNFINSLRAIYLYQNRKALLCPYLNLIIYYRVLYLYEFIVYRNVNNGFRLGSK